MSCSWVTLVLGSCLAIALGTNVPTTAKTSAAPSSEEKHSLLDKLPILELLKSPKVMEGYTGCILEKGPCTPDAAEVKGILPDALTKACSKCTPMQKQVVEKIMLHTHTKQPEIFKQITAKYDPRGEFSKTQLARLKKTATN